ncbi:MAG: hypothetical protein Q9218_007019 [Villophora microphyllina]
MSAVRMPGRVSDFMSAAELRAHRERIAKEQRLLESLKLAKRGAEEHMSMARTREEDMKRHFEADKETTWAGLNDNTDPPSSHVDHEKAELHQFRRWLLHELHLPDSGGLSGQGANDLFKWVRKPRVTSDQELEITALAAPDRFLVEREAARGVQGAEGGEIVTEWWDEWWELSDPDEEGMDDDMKMGADEHEEEKVEANVVEQGLRRLAISH